MDVINRRYETIRTEFSRYLSKKRGKSGSGADDVVLDPKCEHRIWLKPFIISRKSSGNFKRVQNKSAKSISVQPREEVSSSDESHDGTDLDEESEDNCNTVQASDNQSVNESTPNNSTKEKNTKTWRETKSRKRKLEETDVQLDRSIASLIESIKEQDNFRKSGEKQQMDEDSLYCMSLANRLRKLDDRSKAVVRNSVEKVFLDIQFGMQNTMQFTQQQPMQLGSQNMLGSFMWPLTNNQFTAQSDQQVE